MRKKRKSLVSQQPTETLAAQAESHLGAGRYRDAIDAYKQLLKREERPAWRKALADAYMGRAEQLAAKGLYREAVALWENMAASCGERRQPERYVGWLMQAGRRVRGARMFVEMEHDLLQSSEGRRLSALVGGLLVGDQGDIAEVLPAESPLMKQREAMQAAMEAYCREDDATLREYLKSIPFRSPYRDLRLILQVLAALPTESRAVVQLDKIPTDSPFARFAQVVRTAALDGTDLLEALPPLTDLEQKFILTLRGMDERTIKQIGKLSDVQKADPGTWFKFAVSAGDVLDQARLERYCRGLLPAYPKGLAAFEKRFGPLSSFERERIHALTAERHQDARTARMHWASCLARLKESGTGEEDALQAALILRHMADLRVREVGPNPRDEMVYKELADSLKLDPEDKETYLRLMEMARRRNNIKEQSRWAEQAVERFPEDGEILMAAGTSAYRKRAFKKAAGFAHALLKRDPINPHARTLLISCHLAHARKQMGAKRYDLAERELEAAGSFAREDKQRGIVDLNQGLLALLRRQEGEAETFLRQGLRRLGGGLVAQFRFMVDGRRLRMAQATLTKVYNKVKEPPPPPTPAEILELAEFLHRYLDDGVKEVPDILNRLRKPLKAAAKLDFSEQEMQTICAALQRAGHHSLLKDYADAALRQIGYRPIFLYYYVFGRTHGKGEKATPLERMQLQGAADRAIEAEDQATAARIDEFLGLPSFGPGGLPPLPPDLAEDFQDAIEDLMDHLDTDNIEDVLNFMEERLREAGELPPLPRGRRR